MDTHPQQENYDKQANFILDHPVSLASELMYSCIRDMEDDLRKLMDKTDYTKNEERLDQARFLSMFINKVLHCEGGPKPIHVKSFHEQNNPTIIILIYHHKNRQSPYLLLFIELDYVPLVSVINKRDLPSSISNTVKQQDEKNNTSSLPNDKRLPINIDQQNSSNPIREDQRENSSSFKINKVKNGKSIVEAAIHDLIENGFTFESEIEKKQVTLYSAICVHICGTGASIMYEVYDPISEL